MSVLRSGPLAAWATAWLAGRVGLDQVVDAVAGADLPHTVCGLPGFEGSVVGLREVLVTWRRNGSRVRVVLPVAGDVRGVPGPAPFRGAAVEAGEAAVGGALGVVPEILVRPASSAPPSVRWHAFVTEEPPLDELSVADAQYELTTAIRDTASALTAAQLSGRPVAGLRDAHRAGERINLPAGHPQQAVALLAQAERLTAVLELALADATGGAVDRAGIAARADALRPLVLAVRRARIAAYNAGNIDSKHG